MRRAPLRTALAALAVCTIGGFATLTPVGASTLIVEGGIAEQHHGEFACLGCEEVVEEPVVEPPVEEPPVVDEPPVVEPPSEDPAPLVPAEPEPDPIDEATGPAEDSSADPTSP